MNDFEQCLEKCVPNMYADDTSVTCCAEDIEDLCIELQNKLFNISEWMRQNKMSLNTKKSEFMIIGHKQQLNRIQNPIHLEINGEEIKRVHDVKYLGVIVDENSYRGNNSYRGENSYRGCEFGNLIYLRQVSWQTLPL